MKRLEFNLKKEVISKIQDNYIDLIKELLKTSKYIYEPLKNIVDLIVGIPHNTKNIRINYENMDFEEWWKQSQINKFQTRNVIFFLLNT